MCVSVRGEFASVCASAVMLWRCTNIFAAMMQAPAVAVRASQAAATVAAKASQAAGIGVRVCVRASCLRTEKKNCFLTMHASAVSKASAPPTPDELEQERLLQEQRVEWAQLARVEALCAFLTGQIYQGQVEKEGYDVVLHDPLPGRHTRNK